jgi:hypothetical protein
MWHYSDLQSRKEMREQAWKEEAWAQTVYHTGNDNARTFVSSKCMLVWAYTGCVVKLIDSMEARILTPMPFSPMK